MNEKQMLSLLCCILVCLLTSCKNVDSEMQVETDVAVDRIHVGTNNQTSDQGSNTENKYDEAFLNQEIHNITKKITSLENDLISSGIFGPNIWDYVETYYADYENQCIVFCIYDLTPNIARDISTELGDLDYLQFDSITPSTIKARVLSCGEWNQENGRQPFQMITLESNEVLKQGQEMSVRIETDVPLSYDSGEIVTLIHKSSYDASDPPVVYAFSIQKS